MNISQLLNSGKYKEALQAVNQKITESPENSQLFYTKATILYQIGDYALAERLYLTLYKKNRNSGELLYSLAHTALGLKQTEKGFYLLQMSYEKGYNQSVYKLLNLMFERKGECEYETCKSCCCKGVVLKGINAKPVSNQESFEELKSNPKQHKHWIKINENKKKEWVFECSQLGDKNACKIHDNRPDICRDFPAGIIALTPACSYTFQLSEPIIKFESPSVFAVIIDILEAYGYHKEVIIMRNRHPQFKKTKQ